MDFLNPSIQPSKAKRRRGVKKIESEKNRDRDRETESEDKVSLIMSG